eukprot:scaffold229680_cov61-Attheya_sp.AAC.2
MSTMVEYRRSRTRIVSDANCLDIFHNEGGDTLLPLLCNSCKKHADDLVSNPKKKRGNGKRATCDQPWKWKKEGLTRRRNKYQEQTHWINEHVYNTEGTPEAPTFELP